MNLFTKQEQTHRLRLYGYGGGGRVAEEEQIWGLGLICIHCYISDR